MKGKGLFKRVWVRLRRTTESSTEENNGQGAVTAWRPEETGGGSAHLNGKADGHLKKVTLRGEDLYLGSPRKPHKEKEEEASGLNTLTALSSLTPSTAGTSCWPNPTGNQRTRKL